MSFAERYVSLFKGLPESTRRRVGDWKVVYLPGNVPPWTDSALCAGAGDEVTWLADGRVAASEELGLWGGPSFHLWARIGERGTIFKGTSGTHTFRAEAAGRLHFATYQGEWGTRDGKLATPVEAYQTVTGAIDVVAIRWNGGAAEGLKALAAVASDDPLIGAEIRRLASPVVKPEGWEQLWFLGDNAIFARRGDGISVRTREDVGILQKRVELDLTPDTTVSWRWLVSKLPATQAENTIPTHDYLSIAVEFDNGLDLTYYWSAALPVGTVFTCPLPTWAARETHMVVRSGAEGLGVWQQESRNLFQDYRAALGEPPKKIVGVWLIAVSLFRHGEGIAEFLDIALANAGERRKVL